MLQGFSAVAGSMSYEQILTERSKGTLDPAKLETYLQPAAYQKAFGVSKAEFDALPGLLMLLL